MGFYTPLCSNSICDITSTLTDIRIIIESLTLSNINEDTFQTNINTLLQLVHTMDQRLQQTDTCLQYLAVSMEHTKKQLEDLVYTTSETS